MQAGKLRHIVEVHENQRTDNAYGESVDNWRVVDGGRVFASVEPLQGRELERAAQVHADAALRVGLRSFAGLTTKHRIRHKGRNLEILAIVNTDDRDVEMTVFCREAV